MLFEVSNILWKMEREQEWSQKQRVQAMIRKKEDENSEEWQLFDNKGYLNM